MIPRPSEEIKSYEEVIGEVVARLPLLSEEWTNYNVSDPGITVLQNFSAFHVIQEAGIREITEKVRRNLLRFMGFTAGVNRPGRAYLVPDSGSGEYYLPVHQRIAAGGTCFETVREERAMQGGLAGVWLEEHGKIREVTYLLQSETIGAVQAFGRDAWGEPEPGNGIWLVFQSMPEPGKQTELYFAVEEGSRNPFSWEHILEFARLSWQCFTGNGWEAVETVDETACFLTGGCVRFTVPAAGAKRYQNDKIDGYVIRCRLLKSSYDCPPVIRAVYDSVIEVEQRKTLAAMFCSKGGQMVLNSAIAVDGVVEVYVQEQENEVYRRYERGGEGQSGRYYNMTVNSRGNPVVEVGGSAFVQDGAERESPPESGSWDGVRSVVVVCWAGDMVPYRNLGTVYGYENQIIGIEHAEHIIQEGFCVIARMKNRDGTEEFQFAVPGLKGEEELGYELLSREGSLRIYHPGYRRECQLFLASCATVKGGEGTLRPGSRLSAAGIPLVSISPERGGTTCESVEELERRFTEDLNRPRTAVTASDYETLVRQTPGLWVDQVKAWQNNSRNRIEIAIKPAGSRRFPKLTDIYRQAVREYLEPRRLAATEIILMGPEYIPISVTGRIRGKKRFGDCRGIVTGFLEQRFEKLASTVGFGGVIPFHVIFRELEELDCVAQVCDLEASSRKAGARVRGGEIRLDNNCLGYLEHIKLEVIF